MSQNLRNNDFVSRFSSLRLPIVHQLLMNLKANFNNSIRLIVMQCIIHHGSFFQKHNPFPLWQCGF